MIDHIANRIQPFLHGKVNLVMHRAQMFSHRFRRFQIRRAFQADRERVQLRPPGVALVLIFDTFRRKAFGYRRDDRGVETAGEQHAIRHI